MANVLKGKHSNNVRDRLKELSDLEEDINKRFQAVVKQVFYKNQILENY